MSYLSSEQNVHRAAGSVGFCRGLQQGGVGVTPGLCASLREGWPSLPCQEAMESVVYMSGSQGSQSYAHFQDERL